MSVRWIAASLALSLTAVAGRSDAHGLDAYRVELVSHERTVELVATPPVSFIARADDNGDGRISREELAVHRPWVLDALADSLRVQTVDGAGPVSVERADVSVPHGHQESAGGEAFVRWTAVLRFARVAAPLRVRCAFASRHPVALWASRATAAGPVGQLALVGPPEGAALTRADADATLFASESRDESRVQSAEKPREIGSRRGPTWWPGALLSACAAWAAFVAGRRRT
jgi:hypothetical protein